MTTLPPAMNAPPKTVDLEGRLISFLVDAGLPEVVGGVDELREGLRQLKLVLAQVAADLAVATERGVGIAAATLDPTSYPHLASFHGFVTDLLMFEGPAELRPWMERMAGMGPPPDAPEVRRWLVHCALHADNPLHRALAQLGLFESFCLNQRALLRAAETHLEPMNGERADVERIAEIELRTLLGSREYAAAVLGLDDPWDVLMSAAFVTLTEHADGLQEEVRRLGSELRRELELRQRLLEKLDELPAAEALLLRNCFAEALGEERLTIEQLQVLHPSVLGSIKRNTLDQRLKRLLARGDDALEPRRRKEPALLDLLLADRVEVE